MTERKAWRKFQSPGPHALKSGKAPWHTSARTSALVGTRMSSSRLTTSVHCALSSFFAMTSTVPSTTSLQPAAAGTHYTTVYGTEDILVSLCNSVTRVLSVAMQGPVHYSAMVQRITKTCLKPDIGCFVLFDGGFSGLVILNFSADAAMEVYERYMLSMGMSSDDLASSFTSDEVSNVLGELMNQVVGDFVSKIRRELQTHIRQNQPKMLVLNQPVVLSVDANLDQPEARRVTFYTNNNNIFYLELAMDRTQFVKVCDFEPQAAPDPDALMEQVAGSDAAAPSPASGPDDETEALLRSLGM